MNLNKTEHQIMQEIEKKGYTTIEHGVQSGTGAYGVRRVNARNSLIQKGLIKITHKSTDRDNWRGKWYTHFASRIERA